MGFLNSLKSIEHKIAQSPIVNKIGVAASYTPTGFMIRAIASPTFRAEIKSDVLKVGNTIKTDAVKVGDTIKKDAISVGNTIKSDIGSAFKFMEYIPYIGGAIIAAYIYSKVR